MSGLNFNANEVEPAIPFEPVPDAYYLVAIKKTEYKKTKAGTGKYLELQCEILDGDHKGRTLFHRLNLNNPNEIAVKIARAELSAICRAVGVMEPKDTVELENIPLVVKVICKKRDDDPSKISNEIKGFESKKDHAEKAVAAPASEDTDDGCPF